MVFDPFVAIGMIILMLGVVAYVGYRSILVSAPVYVQDEKIEMRSQLEKQMWHAPELDICEMLMSNSNNKMQASGMVHGQTIWPNADVPIPFENEYFHGKLLFLLRTQYECPKWQKLFEGKRRLFWIQLQGQFKVKPIGTVYIGGEIPKKMNLGFLTRGMVRILLSLLNCLVVGLHSSLGYCYPKDVVAPEEEELPHLCFPLHSSVDEFICTPAGQVPPELGSESFGETKESRALRKSGKQQYEYNTKDTYTFSLFSFHIDFEKWKVVNVPGMPDTSLKNFWETMPLRIIAYSLKKPHERHIARHKQYYFCMKLSPLPPSPKARAFSNSYKFDYDDEESEFLKDEEAHHDQLREELAVYVFTIPAWIEYFSTTEGAKGSGERRVAYLFDILEYTDSTHSTLKKHRFALHTAVQTNLAISLLKEDLDADEPNEHFTIQTSTSTSYGIDKERCRIQRDLLHIAVDDGNTSLSRKIAAKTALKRLLTQKSSVVPHAPFFSTRPGITNGNQGQIIRMLWDSHWRNEWLVLDVKMKQIKFFRTQSSTPCLTIGIADIFDVTPASDYLNLPPPSNSDGMFWFQIETLHHVHCIAVASLGECEFWHRVIVAEMDIISEKGTTLMAHDLISKPYNQVAPLLGKQRFSKAHLVNTRFEDTEDTKRNILNDRRIGVRFGSSEDLDICDVVEQALRMGILLKQHPNMCLTHEVLMFLDVAASIKQVNSKRTLAAMSVPDRTAFFLNLYHLQVLHGHFVDTLPTSKASWSTFFNGVAYDVSGYIFSPAEIEHCIIRAPLPSIKVPFTSYIIPEFDSMDPRCMFQLTSADYRLNFALNPTTRSSVNVLTIYHGFALEHQLNFMARLVLSTLVSADMRKHTIYLPRMIEWCQQDFNQHQPTGIVRILVSFLDGDLRHNVEQLLNQPNKVSIKYLSYDYSFQTTLQLSSWKISPSNAASS
ncbi:hypothetical protein THRCLA_09175 [Thraustotheca clavata]|uniref:Uncharacterized protein n=1 Tax=Thraustotheca clavata TaxID=74557 RepID=A0A1V9YYZ4_9STRA|nr:hypothetical protein THRCLA_09175 [Thraustotheca clavata]